MYSVFLSSYRNTREGLGELKSCGNNRMRLVFPLPPTQTLFGLVTQFVGEEYCVTSPKSVCVGG